MLLAYFFGWEIVIAYVVVGLILVFIGGTIIEKNILGNHVGNFVKHGGSIDIESPTLTMKERLNIC